MSFRKVEFGLQEDINENAEVNAWGMREWMELFGIREILPAYDL